MAHQLAHYLKVEREAESEPDRVAARNAAADLIRKLWHARRHWPYGWPPAEVSKLRELLEDLEPLPQRELPSVDDARPWLGAILEIQELQREEVALYRHGAIAELDMDTIAALISVADNLDTSDEVDLRFMRSAVQLRATTNEWFTEHAEPGEKPDRRSHRAQIIERELAGIDERRRDLLGRAGAYARSYRRRPSKLGPSVEPVISGESD